MITLNDAPRDVKIDRASNDKYESLSKRFKVDKKSVFILAMKAGFFYNTQKKIKKPPQSLVQFSSLSEEDVKNMIIIAFSTFGDISKIFQGKEVLELCEEFANGGVEYLYNLFSTEKEDVRIIEDVIDELTAEII